LASVLVIAGSFSEILSYFIFVVVAFVALSVAGLFVLRREDSTAVRYLTPAYPVTPIAFLVMIVITLVLLGAQDPKHAFLGAAVVALGFPVYLFLFRNKRLVERRTTQ
jgi:APA family basic amino acid/polyamine antiporter